LVEEEKEEEGGGEGEVSGGAKSDRGDCQPMIVQEEQEGGGQRDGIGDRPGGALVEQGDGGARQREKDGERWQFLQCDVGDRVRGIVGGEMGVFPGIDEEAVEAAERSEEQGEGEQRRAEVGTAGDGGDESCGGEEEADGNLFGKAVGNLLQCRSAARGVDENEVGGDEASEDDVEVDGFGFEVGKKESEGDGGKEDSREEGGTVAVVEVVAGFEALGVVWVGVKETRVHEAIGSVEHPDGDGHRQSRREGKADVVRRSNEPCPESSDGWGIEGEKMPEGERTRVADDGS
jgi:hypothetical protein